MKSPAPMKSLPPKRPRKPLQLVLRTAKIPGSDVGKIRQNHYVQGFRQIDKAIKSEFYIECIAICESIIADRLEARLACIHQHDPSTHYFDTIGNLIRNLELDETSDDPQIGSTYEKIRAWSKKRNTAVHQVVNLGKIKSNEAWDSRYRRLRTTAIEGRSLAREIDNKVRTLNPRDYEARKLGGYNPQLPYI